MDSFCLLTAALTWKQWCSAQGPQCSHNEMVKDLSLRDTPGKALGLNFKMDWGWDPELSPRPHVPSQAELWILDLPVQPCSQSDFLCSKSSKEGFNQGKALLGPIYRPHLSSAPFSLLQELWPQARYQMQVCVPEAQWGQTDLNIRVWCRERFIAGPSKGNGWLMLKKHQLLDGFQGEVFIGKIWGEGCKVCDFPLIGWWWSNRAGFPGIFCSAWNYHPPPVWGPFFLQKNSKIFPEEEPGHCLKAELLFFDFSSLVSAFPPFLD